MELGFLRPLDRPGPWTSVYLETSHVTQDAAKQDELRRRAVAVRLTDQGTDDRTRAAVLDRLAGEPVSGAPPGRALFAADGRVVLDLPLDLAPTTTEVVCGPLPHIAPLLGRYGEEPGCLVAHIDRNGADLERRQGRARERCGHAEGPHRPARGHRGLPADRYEWHYRHRVENDWNRTAESIAAELTTRWARRRGADLLLLAGEPRERAAVRDRLPGPLREVTFEAGNGGGGRADGAGTPLDREIERARHEHARRHLAEVLELFGDGHGRPGEHGAPGVAAEGVPAVVDAARGHRVATLLLREPEPADAGRQVWVGPEPEHLGARRGDVRAMGVREPGLARADDALLRSAVAADAEALLVPPDAPAPGPVGGVGAVLRWSA